MSIDNRKVRVLHDLSIDERPIVIQFPLESVSIDLPEAKAVLVELRVAISQRERFGVDSKLASDLENRPEG